MNVQGAWIIAVDGLDAVMITVQVGIVDSCLDLIFHIVVFIQQMFILYDFT